MFSVSRSSCLSGEHLIYHRFMPAGATQKQFNLYNILSGHSFAKFYGHKNMTGGGGGEFAKFNETETIGIYSTVMTLYVCSKKYELMHIHRKCSTSTLYPSINSCGLL